MKTKRTVPFCVVLLLVLGMSAALRASESQPPVPKTASEIEAAKLLQQALLEESQGNAEHRLELLEKSRQAAPHYAPLRWHAGELKYDGKWLSVNKIQEQAARDRRLIEYGERREQLAGFDPAEQLALAIWCRKNKLEAEARFHWLKLLDIEPENAEALREMRLQRYEGVLLTPEEILQKKKASGAVKRSLEHWRSSLSTWRRSLESNDPEKRQAAIAKLEALDDLSVIPAYETLLMEKDPNRQGQEFTRQYARFLARMPDQPATEALVRQATFSNWPKVSQLACDELKKRDLMTFVPMLVGNMQGPIVSTFTIQQRLDGVVIYSRESYREGSEADDAKSEIVQFVPKVVGRAMRGVSFKESKESPKESHSGGSKESARDSGKDRDHDRGKDRADDRRDREEAARAAARAREQALAKALSDAHSRAAQDTANIQRENLATEARNKQICWVLRQTTGADNPSTAEAWWDWWIEYNDLHYTGDKPVRHQQQFSTRQSIVVARMCSCFVKGTPVWTLSGVHPIESIKAGDRVLAQDPNSGELAFKLVLATTLRPESPMTKITTAEEEIITTTGHRFWTEGRGWKMAKHLKSGTSLHSVRGPVSIDAIDESEPVEAYNLVVQDFHTYFVGQGGLLVHDISAPKPTLAVVPGLISATSQPAASSSNDPVK